MNTIYPQDHIYQMTTLILDIQYVINQLSQTNPIFSQSLIGYSYAEHVHFMIMFV